MHNRDRWLMKTDSTHWRCHSPDRRLPKPTPRVPSSQPLLPFPWRDPCSQNASASTAARRSHFLMYVSAAGNRLAMLDQNGTLTMTRNWLKTGWVESHSGGDPVVAVVPGRWTWNSGALPEGVYFLKL